MDNDLHLKVQAFVDGELPEGEAREMAALAARQPEIGALIRELRNTRAALAGAELDRTLPESREFYWSKIQREIDRLTPPDTRSESRPSAKMLWRWLVPSTGLAALLAAGYLFVDSGEGNGGALRWQASYAGVNALTYRDSAEGMTVMWLSYPEQTGAGNAEDEAIMY